MAVKHRKKRGAAMEMAIMTMLEIFALCLIIVTVAELGAALNKRITSKGEERTKISQIADLFVNYCSSYEEGEFNFAEARGDYTAHTGTVTGGTEPRYYLDLRLNKTGETVIYVVCDGDGNILRWTNYAPDIEETTPTDPVATGD